MSLSVNFFIVETYAPNFAVSASRGNKLASKIAIGPEELSVRNGLTARYSSLFSHFVAAALLGSSSTGARSTSRASSEPTASSFTPGFTPTYPPPCAFNI